MGAVVAFPNFEKYGGVRRSRMVKSGAGVDFPQSVKAYPASLALLWSSARPFKSLKGSPPVYTDTPTVDADGVTPGDGPSFEDVVVWSDGGTLVVEFTATTASADLVGDVQVFGPLYACSTGLKAKDGTNVATSWDGGDVVAGVVQTDGAEMRISNGTTFSAWTNFDGTMPAMAFADTAPGDLRRIEEWSKVTPRPGMLTLDGEVITWDGEPLYWEGI